MDCEEEIVKIIKEHSIDHHHEGVLLQESWFDVVAEEIQAIVDRETKKARIASYKDAYKNATKAMSLMNDNVQTYMK
jgi:hypothetical protein